MTGIEMTWAPINKPSEPWRVQPHLLEYEKACADFSWNKIRLELDGLPGGLGLNIAHEAVDRHAAGPHSYHPAIRWLSRDGAVLDLTYADLKERTDRFANVLSRLGVNKGERVFTLTGRIPELYVAAIGAWKQVAVFCPLFSAFGPELIYQRLRQGDAKVLVTTTRLYRQRVADLRECLPQLKYVLLTDAEKDLSDDVRSLPQCMAQASGTFVIPLTDPEDMAILHFTSGTTGMPKGAVHVHEAVLTHYMTGKVVLDFHPADVFWCTADPGWVTGTSYGIIAPLVHGVTNIIVEADFDAQGWYRVLEREKVTLWYTAPTAIRRMMRLGIEPRQQYDLSHLRIIHSVGEPLNPEAVVWGQETLGLPIHDNWWQTETGGIMIANFPAVAIRPGSMGLALPGIEAAIVRRVNLKTVEVIKAPGVQGELALKPGWPAMFRGYLHDDSRYKNCFRGGWYLTGDMVRRDIDGYFWFVGRADDIIKTSGHMVGPFEVERVLMAHPAVAEAGVIGKPHAMIGELVKAFVVLRPGVRPGENLRLELTGFARKRLGSAVAPREIVFEKSLPKNRAGKIMRRLLKARELGIAEGDTSTLETTSD